MKNKKSALFLKILFLLLIFVIWHTGQVLLEENKVALGGISYDRFHVWLAPFNTYLNEHVWVANAVLIITSFHIDVILVGLGLWGIFGKTVRPLIGIALILFSREFCQFIVSENIPAGMVWHYPGFPSLVVTYHTSLDFYYSGHSASAMLSVMELWNRKPYKRSYFVIAFLLLWMEFFSILAMRFHYSIDVITGLFAGAVCFSTAKVISPYFDRYLNPDEKTLNAHNLHRKDSDH